MDAKAGSILLQSPPPPAIEYTSISILCVTYGQPTYLPTTSHETRRHTQIYQDKGTQHSPSIQSNFTQSTHLEKGILWVASPSRHRKIRKARRFPSSRCRCHGQLFLSTSVPARKALNMMIIYVQRIDASPGKPTQVSEQ